jgi:hypothetical protein
MPTGPRPSVCAVEVDKVVSMEEDLAKVGLEVVEIGQTEGRKT